MTNESNANQRRYEVEVRGVKTDRDLALVLGQRYAEALPTALWQEGKVVVAFPKAEDANEFVSGTNGRPFKGGVPLSAKLLTPLPTDSAPSSAPARAVPASPAGAAARSAAINTTRVKPGTDKRRPAPYHFVPVVPSLARAEEPVLHDRWNYNCWSGELRLTLRALTPLLAGNDQYDYGDAVDSLRRAYEQLVSSRGVADPQVAADKKLLEPMALPAETGSASVGRVLISGAAQKGMLRHSLAALFSAPMERVWERTFSYRLNVQFPSRPAVTTHIGVVTHIDASGVWALPVRDLKKDVVFVDGRLEAAVAQALRGGTLQVPGAIRRASAFSQFRNAVANMEVVNPVSNALMQSRRTNKLLPQIGNKEPGVKGFHAFPYRFGLDGKGVFYQAFSNRKGGYCCLLLRLNLKSHPVCLGPADTWQQTIEHLSDDVSGHLRDHPIIGDRSQTARSNLKKIAEEGLRPGDIVCFEMRGGKVVTLGHNFRYRYRYRDSIHKTKESDYQRRQDQAGPADLRRVLCPLPLETQSHDGTDAGHPCGKPKGLSIARRMFGYVGSSEGKYSPTEPMTFGIGLTPPREDRQSQAGEGPAGGAGRGQPTDFAQLAGRVAFNTAVEVIAPGKEADADRFLNAEHACLVPLRPLGAPKPSAVEHYLTQDLQRIGRRNDAGILSTYGDTEDDPSAGDLRGRKFYLHQPDAARLDKGHSHCFELGVPDPRPSDWGPVYSKRKPRGTPRQANWRMDEDREMLVSNQAMIGRFVSKPGTEFRTTLRFTNLEAWELGALILCLAPSEKLVRRLAERLDAAGRPVLEWLKQRGPQANEDHPLLANKLGHGRPLGLGSVRYGIDSLVHIQPASGSSGQAVGDPVQVQEYTADALQPQVEQLIDALADWLMNVFADQANGLERWVGDVFLPWLEIHRYAGRKRYDYPRDVPRKPQNDQVNGNDETIFNYHSNLRQKHALGRKEAAAGDNKRDHYGLKALRGFD